MYTRSYCLLARSPASKNNQPADPILAPLFQSCIREFFLYTLYTQSEHLLLAGRRGWGAELSGNVSAQLRVYHLGSITRKTAIYTCTVTHAHTYMQ